MSFELNDHQIVAIDKLGTGSILMGGVGSGKSRVALAYYNLKESSKDLYIITTARKRDTFEWKEECTLFPFSKKNIVIDSWNNISKYTDISNAFFIFDEQRLIGNGKWVKSFLKIVKNNNWILLSATPGDTWLDYIPVFIANGFYKNRTEFIRRHVVYKNFSKFPKVDRFVDMKHLEMLRKRIIVFMPCVKHTIAHEETIIVGFDQELFNTVLIKRWNFYKKKPIKDVGELCYLARKVVNSDPRRLYMVQLLIEKHPKVIVFYNFNYELELLLQLAKDIDIPVAQWNGHKHELIPETETWMYLVQYTAGAEGWNCIETNVVIFFSLNYSYKIHIQAAGRIDRMNTPFTDLYYYYLKSTSRIDSSIEKAQKNKQIFNERLFLAA